MARKTTTAGSTDIHRRKVFVDTGGWYGVTSEQDRQHTASVAYYRNAVESKALLLTSDYVLDETLTRLRYDFGHRVAMQFWERITQAEAVRRLLILRVDVATWSAALDIFARYEDQDFSFTDCTSFVLAQREQVDEVFAFDHQFRQFGLIVHPAP
jgi:predicted nucleic acid-binding protein